MTEKAGGGPPIVADPWRCPAILWCTALWAATVLAAELLRPPLPIDETRYLAVAWEMFQSGDWTGYVVPHLNGAPYDHKPPLLFWLMTAGWRVFGVNDWWPSLVAPLFGLASLGLVVRLAGLIWPAGRLGPDARKTAALAPLVLIGGLFWSLFATLTMFDTMLVVFALIAIGALVKAWRNGGRRHWILVAFSIGLGVLAKGPVILLHVLPTALLAPLWGPKLTAANPKPPNGWKGWYLDLLLATLGGAVIALAWAAPAGILGGEEYRNAIFFGQSAGRVINADDHARPWWWFFAVLPVMLLPWTIWPPMWRAFGRLPAAIDDAGVRLTLVWLVPALAAFSIIDGKQPHYLLPELPALSILAARLLTEPILADRAKPRDQWWPTIPLCAIALIAAAFPHAAPLLAKIWEKTPEEAVHVDGYWLLVFVGLALVVAVRPLKRLGARLTALSGMTAALVVCLHLACAPLLATHYDLRPLATKIRAWMEEGRPVAYYGKYHGEFQFTGRLPHPIERIPAEIFETTDDWAWEHPHGIVVFKSRARIDDDRTLVVQPFRSGYFLAWPASAAERYPSLIVNGMSETPPDRNWEQWNADAEALRPELVRKGKVERDWTPFGPPKPVEPTETTPPEGPVEDRAVENREKPSGIPLSPLDSPKPTH